MVGCLAPALSNRILQDEDYGQNRDECEGRRRWLGERDPGQERGHCYANERITSPVAEKERLPAGVELLWALQALL